MPKLLLAQLPPVVQSPMYMDLGGLRMEPSLLEEKWDGNRMGYGSMATATATAAAED